MFYVTPSSLAWSVQAIPMEDADEYDYIYGPYIYLYNSTHGYPQETRENGVRTMDYLKVEIMNHVYRNETFFDVLEEYTDIHLVDLLPRSLFLVAKTLVEYPFIRDRVRHIPDFVFVYNILAQYCWKKGDPMIKYLF